jgi:sortase A
MLMRRESLKSLRSLSPRRAVIGLLVMLGVGLLAQGLWIPAKAVVAQVLLDRAWDESKALGGAPVKPWPWADHWPVARLHFPQQGESHVVLSGDQGAVLAFAPGHNPQSAALSSALGTKVISAHRDTHFTVLRDVLVGESVTLETQQGTRSYRVTQMDVIDIRQHDLEIFPEGDDSMLLVTCYPFDTVNPNGPLRLVVRAMSDQKIVSDRVTMAGQ